MRTSDSWRTYLANTHLPSWFCTEDPDRIGPFDPSTLFLLVVTGIWYSAAYICFDVVPAHTVTDPHGWWLWWDQGQYYKTTTELAHGELRPSVYWLGYPLLGVPFYRLMPLHPYFVPNLILVMAMVGSFFCACRHFMGRIEAWTLIVIFIFAQPVLRDSCLIVPWNTLPGYAAIYLSAYLLLFHRAKLALYGLCALFVGIAVFSRPTEVLPLTAIYLLGLLNLSEWRPRAWALGYLALSGAVVGAATLGLNLYFYGHLSSPYIVGEGAKFSTDHYGLKIYQLLCDGTLLTGHASDHANLPVGAPSAQILERYPVYLFLVPGVMYLVKTGGARMLGLPLAIISAVAFNLTYNPVNNPPYFWLYGSYHYFWWIIPWLGFFAYLSFRRTPFVFSRGVYLAALLLPVLLFLLIGYQAVTVASSGDLALTTHYAGRSYFVSMVAPTATRLMDLRLAFQTPPSYPGTDSGSAYNVAVTVNGTRKFSMVDYMMSQDGNAFDFDFLLRDLRLKKGDRLEIVFNETDEPKLTVASLLDVAFRWGHPGHSPTLWTP